jgi:hypothetical protein
MTRLYLAVGHGIKSDGTFDPGAVGGGWTEQTAGDIVVSQAAWLLRKAGVEVRDESYQDDPNYVGTTRAANAWPANLAVSVHHDWSGAPLGGFGLYISTAGSQVAYHVREAYLDHGLTVRANDRRTDLYFLNQTTMPAMLWECGRIGQYSANQLQLVGDALACGLATHLDIHDKLPPHGRHGGSTGSTAAMLDLVRSIQAALNAAGYLDADGKPLTEDGVWGTKTQGAFIAALRAGKHTHTHTHATAPAHTHAEHADKVHLHAFAPEKHAHPEHAPKAHEHPSPTTVPQHEHAITIKAV